ncbi:hypothetical protein WS63_00950 [Burkholderia stagnalis]|uniref:hypothetical protein n=1 Tax=Burkholderia stagnalis TaxID=1503054 RepID=UPI00075E58FF|nr:hypothetical protein [Burkholderia stagnalis]KVD88264.1 hypothetical protein WS63_00950 [Burkholderia stagnalis]
MKMRLFPALILFLGSYFPLSLILLVQDVKETSWKTHMCRIAEMLSCHFPELANPERALGLLGICAVSLVIFMVLMRNLSGYSSLDVIDSKSIPNDLINYVFPYVVSFMGLDLGVNGKFFGFLLFIVLMFLITFRSGQILMNPFLLIAGWQLYELNIVTEGRKRCVKALSKEPVRSGDHLESCLVHGIYVLHRGEK